MAKLVRESPHKKIEVDLDREYMVFGRSDGCDVVIEDPEMSREHCGVRHYSDDRFTVIDFGSRNGTFVNDERIFEEHKLAHGDRLRMGRRAEFVFTDPEHDPTPETAAATPPEDDKKKAAETPRAEEEPPQPTEKTAEATVPAGGRPAPLLSAPADNALSRALDDVQKDLQQRSYHSVLQDIVRTTRKKRDDNQPNKYW